MLFGVVVFTEIVMMLGLMVVVGSRVVMGGGLMMMLTGRMLGCLCHCTTISFPSTSGTG